MELREFMSVRCAYSLVRQTVPASSRLTFEEYAILCHLKNEKGSLNTSQIATYQGVLRPTMTHRTNHLAHLGLIERHEGQEDHRNVCCSLSPVGAEVVGTLSAATCRAIPKSRSLSRVTPSRMSMYVDAMGTIFCTAGDLILTILVSFRDGEGTVSSLVDDLGLLQPTVSMSVSNLVERGLIVRVPNSEGTRSSIIRVTPAGREQAHALADRIVDVVVRRQRRSTSDVTEEAR